MLSFHVKIDGVDTVIVGVAENVSHRECVLQTQDGRVITCVEGDNMDFITAHRCLVDGDIISADGTTYQIYRGNNDVYYVAEIVDGKPTTARKFRLEDLDADYEIEGHAIDFYYPRSE